MALIGIAGVFLLDGDWLIMANFRASCDRPDFRWAFILRESFAQSAFTFVWMNQQEGGLSLSYRPAEWYSKDGLRTGERSELAYRNGFIQQLSNIDACSDSRLEGELLNWWLECSFPFTAHLLVVSNLFCNIQHCVCRKVRRDRIYINNGSRNGCCSFFDSLYIRHHYSVNVFI